MDNHNTSAYGEDFHEEGVLILVLMDNHNTHMKKNTFFFVVVS